MKKRKLKRKSRIFLLLIFLLGFGISFCFSISKMEKQERPKNKEEIPKEKEEKPYESPLPSLRNLYQNQDILLELKIPSLDLEEPIVRGIDNVYYLDHDLQKRQTIFGAIFMDYRILDVDQAQQLNIYGHNTELQEIPFQKLERYQQEDFFKQHQEIFINTDQASYSYKVFAVSLVPKSSDEHMIVSLKEEAFEEHVLQMRKNALYDTKEEIKKTDHILLLQTCLFHPEQFLIVFAKRI